MLRPIGDRVIIKPLQNPDQTDSGLLLPENRTERYLDMQGIVVAVGPCAHPRKHEADQLACLIERRQAAIGQVGSPEHEAATMLRDLVAREPAVKVGDHVLFSWKDGQEVTIDDDTYLMMRESDILAVLEEEVPA